MIDGNKRRPRIPRRFPCKGMTFLYAQKPVTPQKGKKVQSMGSIAQDMPYIRRLKYLENHTIVSNSP